MKILILIILAIGNSKGLPNTPPHINFDREWTLTEDEPVGSVVTRIRVNDGENDDVKITIGNPSYKAFQGRQDGASYFNIDQDNRVILAKSLTGLAGQTFLVGIIAFDGKVRNRIDARVSVRRKHDHLHNFIPSSYSNSFLPSQISNNLKGLDLDIDDDDGIQGPPLLHLEPFTVWVVPSDAEVGTNVTLVEAQNLRDTSLTFSLSPNEILEIDPQTGRVTTASSLKDKVGNHSIKVNVSDEVEYITEDVVLRVQPTDGFVVPTTPRSSSTFNKFTSSSTMSELPYSLSTEEISYGGSESNIIPDNAIKPTINHSKTSWIIGIGVMIAVFVILGVVFFWWWRRRHKILGTNKENSGSFSAKGESVIHITTARRESIFDDFFSLVGMRRRAESNGYEEEIKLPSVPNRESRKSSKTSTTYLTVVDEKGNDKWEYPRHKIRVLGPLGEGCFGQVWKCEVVDLVEKGTSVVAMKTLKETAGQAEKNDLLQELKVLKSLTYHPNVVALLGCCTEKDPVYVILEYMKEGKLQTYLRSSRAGHAYGNLHGVSSSLTPRDLTIFALQVAKGMDFLSKNGIIHRDLAARNILVGEDKICKVADFGFARNLANNNVYQRKSDGRMPIRWMAPESLFDNIYSTKCDVWSFGILLWEIVTLGSTPYPGMAASEVMKRVKNGYRLEKPDHCRREIYNIMYYCWDFESKERPSFPELVKSLESLIMSEVDYIQLEKFPEHNYYNFTSVSTSAELL